MENLELLLTRKTFTDKSTIGDLTIDGQHECFILEDKDRGLNACMDLVKLNAAKVFGETCIPYGRYQVVVTLSQRFTVLRGKPTYLPLLLNVPGYDGVRIHIGNRPEDTEGCLLPARNAGQNIVTHSIEAWTDLNDKINNAIKAGKQPWITIKKG